MRMDLTIKPIQNGWVTIVDISGQDMVTTYYPDELTALIALKVMVEKTIELTQEEMKNGAKTN